MIHVSIPSIVAGALFCAGLAFADGPAAGAGGTTPSPKPAPRASRPAKVEGVTIEFQARKLDAQERTPEGELKAIGAATATMKTERPIRYRSLLLPPGTYPVTIATDPVGRNMFFVIGTEPKDSAPAKPEEKKGENGKSDGGRKAGSAKEASQIRALFHVRTTKTPSEAVEFSVRPNAKGDRFAIIIVAGASTGKATLQLAK